MKNEIINWDQYFMTLALASGMRSKDPSTQVGACIVDNQNKVVSLGYNGLTKGMVDSDFSWTREGKYFDTKYPYVVHAEQNAILNAKQDLSGCTIYVSLFPCHECAKLIIQSGITTVVFMDNKYEGTDSYQIACDIFSRAKVSCYQMNKIELSVSY